MPLTARSFLPYTLPGVLALLGLWWYTSRKKELPTKTDGEKKRDIGLLSSPDESANGIVEPSYGETLRERSNTKEQQPTEHEIVAYLNTLTTSMIDDALSNPIVAAQSFELGTSCHSNASTDCHQSSPEVVGQMEAAVLSLPFTLSLDHEPGEPLNMPVLHRLSQTNELQHELTDTTESIWVTDQAEELATVERPEPEGDYILAVQCGEKLQASVAENNLSSINEEPTFDMSQELFSCSLEPPQSPGPNCPVICASCPISTSSPATNDAVDLQHCQNGIFCHPTEGDTSMENLHFLAANIISEVLLSAAHEVSSCESLHKETSENAPSSMLTLNGTEIIREDGAAQVGSFSQSHPTPLLQTPGISNGSLTSTLYERQEDFTSDEQLESFELITGSPEVQEVIEACTQDSGYSMCRSENAKSELLSADGSSAVLESKVKRGSRDQLEQLESSEVLSTIRIQQEVTLDGGDATYTMCQLGSINRSNPIGKDLTSAVPNSKLQDSFAPEETVAAPEDSGCSTCQSEDGISSEDFLSMGLSPAVSERKKDHVQTLEISTIEECEDGLQNNSHEAEVEEPILSTELVSANCVPVHLNGEDLRNGTSEAEADQSGSDVNSMDSLDSCLTLGGDDGQLSGSPNTPPIVWEIEVPRHLVGRLIGKKGRYVSFLKQTSSAKIYISTLPYTQEIQICHIEGSQQQVDKALALIGKKFKDLNLNNVYSPQSLALPMPSLSMTSWLLLPTGVAVEVIVVNIVSAGHVFVQQHTHPTYHALRSLDQQMFLCYSQPGTPALPSSAEVGVICAAPVMDGAWWRAQVISFYKESDEVEIRYVDYGGYERVKNDTLRQIRSDFVTLPFQGTEVLLDNLTPLSGEDQFSADANSALEEMTRGVPLLAQVTNYDNNTGLPLVQMWSMVGEELVLLNQTLADRGLATWVDSF